MSKNPNNKPIFRDSNTKIEKMEAAIEYFQKLKVVDDIKVRCINGFIQTLRGFILLFQDIFADYPDVQYILFGKIDQDALENFIGQIRASLGNNNHPSLKELRYITDKLITSKIIANTSAVNTHNCVNDEDIQFEGQLEKEDSMNASEKLQPFEEALERHINVPITEENDIQISDVEEIQAQRYIAVYAIYKTAVTNTKCELCLLVIHRDETFENVSENFAKF